MKKTVGRAGHRMDDAMDPGRLLIEFEVLLMVLHDSNNASRYSRHVIALSEGKVYRAGTPVEMMTEDLSARSSTSRRTSWPIRGAGYPFAYRTGFVTRPMAPPRRARRWVIAGNASDRNTPRPRKSPLRNFADVRLTGEETAM